jgi:hypothetical protein
MNIPSHRIKNIPSNFRFSPGLFYILLSDKISLEKVVARMTRKNKRKVQVESSCFKQLYLFPPEMMDELKRKADEQWCKERRNRMEEGNPNE